jgi:hypothetical protein
MPESEATMARWLRTPFDWSWAVRTYVVVACTVLITLALEYFSTVNTGGGWLAIRKPLPPSTLSACIAEMASADERMQVHARNVLAHVAQQCPDTADLLAPLVATFLKSKDLRVRVQTIEMLGAIGPPAKAFAHEVEASRGAGIAHVDHVIDIALASIRRTSEESPSAGRYCSHLSRGVVEAALRAPANLDWTWENIEESQCSTWPRAR